MADRRLYRQAKAETLGRETRGIRRFLRGDVSPVHEGLENAVDAGFRDLGALVDVFQGHRSILFFEHLEYVERLGENRK